MKPFERKLIIGDWTEHPAIRHLFSRWELPGRPSNGGLRIGIRPNGLNLYARGQSVALLSGGQRSTKVSVSNLYSSGITRGTERSQAKGKGSRSFWSDEITCNQIDQWIATAATYSEPEKAFVDDLVAANPGTIELEMALPTNTGERSAPRMDLVLAQDGDIAFWEAKCSTNAELRARAAYRETDDGAYENGIKVVHQLRTYVRWMDFAGFDRRAEMAKACREVSGLLLIIADMFERPGDEARAAWRMLRDNPAPHVILAPGLAIGNYDALTRIRDAIYAQQGIANERYIETLRRRHGACVAEIPSADCAALPLLQPHTVCA